MSDKSKWGDILWAGAGLLADIAFSKLSSQDTNVSEYDAEDTEDGEFYQCDSP